jgi:hypothetical protein
MPGKQSISSILGSRALASSVEHSIKVGLRCPWTTLVARSSSAVFDCSLKAAIRDIECHPHGQLFQRLILHGPAHGLPLQQAPLGLSDQECATSVEFIYSHMINRFKGEIAELLAIAPTVNLSAKLLRDGVLPEQLHLYWGEVVWEPPLNYAKPGARNVVAFKKGADGLLVQRGRNVKILGAAEVKSMRIPRQAILSQIEKHFERLKAGLRLADKTWPGKNVKCASGGPNAERIQIIVMPSHWKISREYAIVKAKTGDLLQFPQQIRPPVTTRTRQIEKSTWEITLSWSVEAIAQAAYEMTFWYMAEVGKRVYRKNNLPDTWSYMKPEQAGLNSIKQMLYLILNRCNSYRQFRLTTRLYNAYSFGLPAAIDHDELLSPEDFD